MRRGIEVERRRERGRERGQLKGYDIDGGKNVTVTKGAFGYRREGENIMKCRSEAYVKGKIRRQHVKSPFLFFSPLDYFIFFSLFP